METNSAFAESVTLIPVLKRRDRNITHLVQLFLAKLQHENAAQPLLLDTLSTALSVYLLREYTTAKPEKVSPSGLSSSALNHVLDYIHAHLADDLSLSRLAQEAGISRCYFASQFKRSMQITPHHYVNQQRIEWAKQLLKEKSRSIAEIALECGFSSQSHLTRVFRQFAETTPKAYRD